MVGWIQPSGPLDARLRTLRSDGLRHLADVLGEGGLDNPREVALGVIQYLLAIGGRALVGAGLHGGIGAVLISTISSGVSSGEYGCGMMIAA